MIKVANASAFLFFFLNNFEVISHLNVAGKLAMKELQKCFVQ